MSLIVEHNPLRRNIDNSDLLKKKKKVKILIFIFIECNLIIFSVILNVAKAKGLGSIKIAWVNPVNGFSSLRRPQFLFRKFI